MARAARTGRPSRGTWWPPDGREPCGQRYPNRRRATTVPWLGGRAGIRMTVSIRYERLPRITSQSIRVAGEIALFTGPLVVGVISLLTVWRSGGLSFASDSQVGLALTLAAGWGLAAVALESRRRR